MVSIPNKNPLALLAEEEQHHLRKLSRMENEMQEVFNKKIELKLKHIEEIDPGKNNLITYLSSRLEFFSLVRKTKISF